MCWNIDASGYKSRYPDEMSQQRNESLDAKVGSTVDWKIHVASVIDVMCWNIDASGYKFRYPDEECRNRKMNH